MNRHSIFGFLYMSVILSMLSTACSGAAASPTSTLLPTLPSTPTQTEIPPTITPIPPTATVSPADPKMAPGVIAFISDRDGNREIYSIKADGSQEARLTDDKRFNNGEPVWSPDGKNIAFVRLPPNKEFGEAGDIWVMQADGSQAMQISPDGSAELQPRWSPDSTRIAYISNMSFLTSDASTGEQVYADAYDVYISDKDGANLHQPKGYITFVWSAMGDLGMITHRNWSPDGQALAYVDCKEESCSIVGISPQGGGFNSDYPLTKNINANDPTWSPDGKKIAFDGPADCKDCGYEIYLMNADGSDLVNLTDTPFDDWGPVWSPDGSHLAFVSDRDGDYELYMLDLGSREVTQLTNNQAYDSRPTWSPDGHWIAYSSDLNGNVDIYIVNVDEKQSYRLTTSLGTEDFPYWSPVASPDGAGNPIPTPVPTATSPSAGMVPAPGVIAFHSNRKYSYDIYTMKPDGSAQTPLTDSTDDELFPVWSPDGMSIAFTRQTSNDEVSPEIWLMRSDGSQPVLIASEHHGRTNPRWSPDGKQIVFETGAFTYPDLFVTGLDGKDPLTLTPDNAVVVELTSNYLITARNWSPDGKTIVFSFGEDFDNLTIMRINSDGSGAVRLTEDIESIDPTYSPDGKKIAFVSREPKGCSDDCTADVYVMNADGSELVNLTDSTATDYNPVWSPDGSKIVISSDRDGNYELYLIDLASNQQTRLTDNPGFDGQPTWSPDGKWIAFASEVDGNTDIYAIELDGKNLFRLTTDPADDYFPYWSPATP